MAIKAVYTSGGPSPEALRSALRDWFYHLLVTERYVDRGRLADGAVRGPRPE